MINNIFRIIVSMGHIAKKLAKRIKELRGDMTQREFAKKLNINVGTLNRIEQGQENITLKTIQRMCSSLNCSVGSLFGESDT